MLGQSHAPIADDSLIFQTSTSGASRMNDPNQAITMNGIAQIRIIQSDRISIGKRGTFVII